MTGGVKGSRRHGTHSCYVGGCRCAACTKGHRDYCAKQRAKRIAELAAGLADKPHGTVGTYLNYGCRCKPCRVANSEDCEARRQHRLGADEDGWVVA